MMTSALFVETLVSDNIRTITVYDPSSSVPLHPNNPIKQANDILGSNNLGKVHLI